MSEWIGQSAHVWEKELGKKIKENTSPEIPHGKWVVSGDLI